MFFLFLDPDEIPTFGPGLDTLAKAMDMLRAVDPGMPVGTASCLLHLGLELRSLAQGTITLRDVARDMDVPYSTFLRSTDKLAEGGSGVRGLNLLEKGISTSDKRARQLRLTLKGHALLGELDALMDPKKTRMSEGNDSLAIDG